jgi:hypothetical protein
MSKPLKLAIAVGCAAAACVAAYAAKRVPVLNMPHHSVLGTNTKNDGTKRQIIRLSIHHPGKDFDASKTQVASTTDMDGTFSLLKIIPHKYQDDDGNAKQNTATFWLLYTPNQNNLGTGGGTGTLTLTTSTPDGSGSTTVVTDPGYDPCADCPP